MLNVNTTVRFQVTSPVTFTEIANASQVTIRGKVSPNIARTYSDIVADHKAAIGTVSGIEDTHFAYDYYIVELPNGAQTAIGEPFIITSTIEVINKQQYIVVVEHTGQSTDITDALLGNGINVISLSNKK